MNASARRVVAVGVLFAGLGFIAIADADELFQARLTGDQEVPAVAADTTGRFEILVNKDATAGEYTLRVNSGVRVTQSHFHCGPAGVNGRSEEHTSELQSRLHLVCRLLLEKKKKTHTRPDVTASRHITLHT